MALVAAEQIFIIIIFFIFVALSSSFSSATPTTACQFNFRDGNKLYNYTLSSPIRNFPHGILSEDGFYKVSVNQTTLWFQLCDGMIFNHDPPRCADCWDCGGPTRCGMECTALVANKIGGYHVCATIGRGPNIDIDVIDKKNPHIGIIVKMSSGSLKHNCSLAVSVLCDLNGVQAPQTLERSGDCDYATEIKHPSGCAMIVNVHGSGWGWFGTLLIILVCLFAVYLLAGIVYRYFFLKIRGIEVIPNLDIWISLPRRTQSVCSSLVGKFKGTPSEGHRSTYSAVNF
ncbi:autophagy protein [Trifolium repens]|nr:autophagy protein [Trifolium repens]